MRPLRLKLEGFGAFRERTEIDFDGAELFALVGPTGAGKSTVIDAVCFALYGSIPRYDDRRRVGDAVSLGRTEAKVSLTFELDGHRYVATRVVRRTPKGDASTKEARLERVLGGGTTEVLEGKVREANDRIEALLGMPFDHFTRCVVLPQGAFARFLHDKPADRQELLVKLLNIDVYGRMAQAARSRAAAHANEVAIKQAALAELAGATSEALQEVRARADALDSLRTRVSTARPEADRLDAAMETARAAAAGARRLAEQLQAVRVPDDVTELAGALSRARGEAAVAEEVASRAEAERDRLQAEADALPPPGPLEAALAGHRQLEGRRADVSRAADALEHAEAAARHAAAAVARAEEILARATDALAGAQRAHLAHEVAAHLAPGQPCPVCEQVVRDVPRREPPAELATARAAEERTRKDHRACDQAQRAAADELTAARTALETHRAAVTALEEAVAGHPDPEALEKQLAEIAAAADAARRARERAAGLRTQATAATQHARGLEQSLAGAARAFDAQRDPLVALEPPARTGADLAADWQALVAWAVAQVPIQVQQAEAAEADVARLREARDALLTALATAAGELGVTIPKGEGRAVDRLNDAVVAALAGARQAVTSIERDMATAATLTAEVADAGHRAEVATTLGELLSARKFERWLVEEALHLLVHDASVTLRRLSADAYSLAIDDRGEFRVIDHRNADETRPAKTLSGGETFQASLALALALADQLAGLTAGGAARLEAIFLDEGFGTLDDETLDVVASTIETLGAGERMVGLITHVKELAERVPVRFAVSKGARTSAVEKVVA